MLPDNTINPGEMTSFNHYALGSIINWLHTTVAGVSPIEPGWKTFRVAPLPGGTITSAEAQYETPYGRLECHWAIKDGDHFHLKLLVPANSKAFVALPDNRKIGIDANDEERGEWVGSGFHQFFSRWDNLAHWPPESVIPIMRKKQPEEIA
jgi:alpha-L-rhamnosidase